MSRYLNHKSVTVSSGLVLQRWTGKAWNDSLCSPYKTIGEIRKHLKEYHWHYTEENPYRIINYKPKKKQKSKYNPDKDWNSDRGMMVRY